MQAATIQLTCQCGRTLAVPSAAAGKTAQCPECGHQLSIPSNSNVESPTAAISQTMVDPEEQAATKSSPPARTSNPYAPVGGTLEEVVVTPDDAEAMRRYYLSHEVSVKSLGLLFILSGLVTMLMGIRLLAPLIAPQAGQRPQWDVHLVIAAAVMVLEPFSF